MKNLFDPRRVHPGVWFLVCLASSTLLGHAFMIMSMTLALPSAVLFATSLILMVIGYIELWDQN
jgi:hypothetical protein